MTSRSEPIGVWAGDAPFPAQTRENPQETNGISSGRDIVKALQIGEFLAAPDLS